MTSDDHGYDRDLIPDFIYQLCWRCKKWVRYTLVEDSLRYAPHNAGRLDYQMKHTCRGEVWNGMCAWEPGDPTNLPLRAPGPIFCMRGSHYIYPDELAIASRHECCDRTFHACKECVDKPIQTARPGEGWEAWLFRMMHEERDGRPSGCPVRCEACKALVGKYDLLWHCVPSIATKDYPQVCGRFCRSCFDGHREVHKCKKDVVRGLNYTCPSCNGGSNGFFYEDAGPGFGHTFCTWCGSSWITGYLRGNAAKDQVVTPPTVACPWCGPATWDRLRAPSDSAPCTCGTVIEAVS